jgi:hypothetical protein
MMARGRLVDFVVAVIAEAARGSRHPAPKLITNGWTPCNSQNAFRTPQLARHRKDKQKQAEKS